MPAITGADTSAGGILECGAICALRRRKYICDAGVQPSIVAPTASVGADETALKADNVGTRQYGPVVANPEGGIGVRVLLLP